MDHGHTIQWQSLQSTNNTTQDLIFNIFDTSTPIVYATTFTYSILCMLILSQRKKRALGSRATLFGILFLFTLFYFCASILHFLRCFAFDKTFGKICKPFETCNITYLSSKTIAIGLRFCITFYICFWIDFTRDVHEHSREISLPPTPPTLYRLLRFKSRTVFWILFIIFETVGIAIIGGPFFGDKSLASIIDSIVLFAILDIILVLLFFAAVGCINKTLKKSSSVMDITITRSMMRHLSRMYCVFIILGVYWIVFGSIQLSFDIVQISVTIPRYINKIIGVILLLLMEIVPFIWISITMVWRTSAIRVTEFVHNRLILSPTTPFEADEKTSLVM